MLQKLIPYRFVKYSEDAFAFRGDMALNIYVNNMDLKTDQQITAM